MTEYRYELHGVLDADTAPRLRRDLRRAIDADENDLLVDCSQLTFIDSTGIAVLLESNARLQAAGRTMRIENVQPGPRLVFEALGLTDLLAVGEPVNTQPDRDPS